MLHLALCPLLGLYCQAFRLLLNLLQTSTHRAPLRRLVSLEEVGGLCAWLVSNASQGQTGGVHFVDGGLNILG